MYDCQFGSQTITIVWRRYGSIEPDPDNPQQSYLDYIESFPLNAEPEVSAPPTDKDVG